MTHAGLGCGHVLITDGVVAAGVGDSMSGSERNAPFLFVIVTHAFLASPCQKQC